MTDYIASLIRTYAPAVVGVVLVAISQALDITDLNTDENKAKVVAGIFVVYYAVVRLLEKKFPKAGWLLFLARTPGYSGSK
jgi:S-adenosylmethionine hydrolase